MKSVFIAGKLIGNGRDLSVDAATLPVLAAIILVMLAVMILFMILILKSIHSLRSDLNAKNTKTTAPSASVQQATTSAKNLAVPGTDLSLVAVITAAIAMMMTEESGSPKAPGAGFTIRSIRRVNQVR